MIATIQTYFDTSAAKAWNALKKKDTFLFITRGFLGFIGSKNWPEEFYEGQEIDTRFVFFHIFPVWKHYLRVVKLDDHRKELYSNEKGGPIKIWNHLIKIEPGTNQRCKYIDQIEIRAGLFTPVVMDICTRRSEIEETGEYDLEGLFIRLAYAIDSIKAKRIVLDTVESLFSGLTNVGILRAELRRLFAWFKDRGVTAVITGESGEKTLTRYGLEEYVADCVITLDFRVREQISTRRLRIIKYRGSSHGADEYPFLIEKTGISILPVTSLGLEHTVSNERISSGIPRLDSMLAGKGFYRGSTILISGTAGTGKTSFASKFVESACRRGERCLYLAFEESADQIMRNMKSIGTDLAPWVKKGKLKFHASRPSLYGLEMHLVTIHNLIADFNPQIIIVDPVSNLTAVGSSIEVKSVLTRLFDYLKASHITTLLTDLVHFGINLETTNEEICRLSIPAIAARY